MRGQGEQGLPMDHWDRPPPPSTPLWETEPDAKPVRKAVSYSNVKARRSASPTRKNPPPKTSSVRPYMENLVTDFRPSAGEAELTPRLKERVDTNRLSWEFASPVRRDPDSGGPSNMLPNLNHPFGSVEELLVQLGPSTPPLSPEEVGKHWTSKGKKEAAAEDSKATNGGGDEMGKLLRELGVFIDKDASAAPIAGGGAPGSAENQGAHGEGGEASPSSGQRSSGKFFGVVKNVFRTSQSQKKEEEKPKLETWDKTVFQRGIKDVMKNICEDTKLGAVQLWVVHGEDPGHARGGRRRRSSIHGDDSHAGGAGHKKAGLRGGLLGAINASKNNSAQNTPLVAYPSGLESPLDIALNRKSSGLPIGSLTSPVDALRGGSKNPGPIKVAGTSFGTKGRGGEVVQEACDRDGEADEEQQIGSGSINRGGRSGGVRKPSILDSFKAREGVDEKRGEHNEGSSGWGTPSRKFSTVSEGGSTTGSESGVRKKKAAFLRMASGSVKNMFGGSALSKSSFKGSLKNVLGLGASKNEDGEHEEGSGRHHHGFLQRLGSGIMNIAEAITHVDGRTCTYQGLHFVQNETLGIGDTTGGITAAKRMAEWDGLERASRAATYMLNQGLPGQAWQRGARQADYSILKYLIDDPERLLDRVEVAAAKLFVGTVAITLEIEETGSVGGVLLCYLPHAHGHKYGPMDYLENRDLHNYLIDAASSIQALLRAEQQFAVFEESRQDFTSNFEKKRAAKSRWGKVRVVTKTGLMRGKNNSLSTTDSVELRSSLWARIKDFYERHRHSATMEHFGIWFRAYIKKYRGLKARPPPRTDLATSIFVVFGCFLSLLIISAGHKYGQSLQGKDYPFFLGSFGALSSLVFGAPQSPYAQPRMIIMSHIIAVSIAIVIDYFTNPKFVEYGLPVFIPQWIANAVVPSLAIAVLAIAGFTHPPAAAASIIYIADIGGTVKRQGWLFIVMPTLAGCLVIVTMGVIVNNLSPARTYPLFW